MHKRLKLTYEFQQLQVKLAVPKTLWSTILEANKNTNVDVLRIRTEICDAKKNLKWRGPQFQITKLKVKFLEQNAFIKTPVAEHKLCPTRSRHPEQLVTWNAKTPRWSTVFYTASQTLVQFMQKGIHKTQNKVNLAEGNATSFYTEK